MRWIDRKRGGFSLLEMMVVIAIIFVLAAIATPSLIRSVRRYQLESAARQVSNMLLRARYEAMRRNQRTCAVFEQIGGENRYGLDLAGPDVEPCDDATPSLINTEPFLVTPVGVEWRTGGNPADPHDWTGLPAWANTSGNTDVPALYRITFSPRGTVETYNAPSWDLPTNPQIFQLQRIVSGSQASPDDAILVTITPMGKVTLYRWVGATWMEM